MSEILSVWVLGDQLLAGHPALAAAEQAAGRDKVRVVLVESAARARRLPYQRKKLVLLFSAMRHYVEELRGQGWQVDCVRAETTLAGLQAHVAQHRPVELLTMAASESAGRRWQQGKLAAQLGLPVRVLPDSQFLAAYVDAYEWVMLPNVLGMGLNADGGRTATKPYVASANYINKMSDYCAGCRYNKKTRTGPDACPFNFLYWNFLLEQEQTLRRNPRLGNAVLGLRHLDQDERARVREQAAAFLTEIDTGQI
jgi:deoxyribodipyrimidine photolyase-like uncharacterized protein